MFVGLGGSKADIVTDKLTPCDEHMIVHVKISEILLDVSNNVTDISGGRDTLEGF